MDDHRSQIYIFNPTDTQRHIMLKDALMKAGRIEDYENVVELLKPPPDITNYSKPGKFKEIKIGIIGGGLAGLSAAFELRKLGANITIFDALDDRIGGRVYTYYFDKDRKQYGELGAMRIPVSHETTWYYINKFKLNTNIFINQNPNAFIYVKDTRVRNDTEGNNIRDKIYPKYNLTELERNTPWPKLYDYANNEPLIKLTPMVRTEILKILPKYSPQYTQLINMSFRQVFEMLGLSQGAIDLISSIDPLTGAFLYFSHSELLHEIYPVNFAVLYRIEGGMVNLPLAFYKSLSSQYPEEYGDIPNYLLGKAAFKLGHFVNEISKSDKNNKVILKYRNRRIYKDFEEEFDYVICTIPFSTLREIKIKPLFSNKKMQAIREINYADAMKTVFLCNRRFWEEDKEYGRINGGISYTDLPIQSIVYPSDHANCSDAAKCSANEPGVLVASYNLAQDSTRLGNISEPRRTELIKRNIEDVHGLYEGYLDTIVSKHKTVHWYAEQWFKGIAAIFNPEQKNIFSYEMLRPEYNNRVFFAGEHTSVSNAWMQGALYSGRLAANMLVAYNNMADRH